MKRRGMRRAQCPGEQARNGNVFQGLSVSECPLPFPGDPREAEERGDLERWGTGIGILEQQVRKQQVSGSGMSSME